jgi:sugar phosphate isomerase/epimerase
MMYATLLFRSLKTSDEHFRLIENLGLFPEINFESGWNRFSRNQHRDMAKLILDHFPGSSIHLPYNGLYPRQEETIEPKKDLLLKALELAELYSPDHLIGHPGFRGISDSVLGQKKYPGFKRDELEGLSQSPAPWWLDQTVYLWSEVLKNTSAKLYLENTHEHSPHALMVLLENLPPRAQFCLDFGHWFHYAMGRHWDNLELWLQICHSKLKHVHVHDNNGEADQHLPLGLGLIDYRMVRRLLKQFNLQPSLTLENHFVADLQKSFAVISRNPLWSIPKELEELADLAESDLGQSLNSDLVCFS